MWYKYTKYIILKYKRNFISEQQAFLYLVVLCEKLELIKS